MSSSIPDHNPEDTATKPTTLEPTAPEPTAPEPAAPTDTASTGATSDQAASAYEQLTGGLDESGTYLLSYEDGSWVAREVVPLITDDLPTKRQLVLEVTRTPAILRDTMHPAARQHIDAVCQMRDLNTYGMSDEFGDPRGSDYSEPVREAATDLLATIWMATWRYGISSTEWYDVAGLPLGCLDMAVHLANRPNRHVAAEEGS